MVVLDIKDFGRIKLELYPDEAPQTVANFEKLVDSGFYNGLTFHRIISGFMIQGGDPTGTGMGSADSNIIGEFSANGITNNVRHKRGTISMARSRDFNSASSQFFICHADCDFLDGQYAAFGKVVEGIEVVDKIAEVRTDNNDKPYNSVIIENAFIEPVLDDNCLFCKIIKGEIPSKMVYEDNFVYSFYDINPQAPVHVLVIPKKHIESVDQVNTSNSSVVAHIFESIPLIAKKCGLENGYRVVSNVGSDACQSVKHLHFHILGGKQLSETMV